MRTYSIQVESRKAPEFIDIMGQVQDAVTDAQIQNGFAIVFSKHTTAAIKFNENEPLLIQDMEDFLERLAPRYGEYRHNDFSIRTVNMTHDEWPNGHAHCQQLLIGTTETIPIVDSVIQYGQWQSVFLIELDRPRTREVLVQVMGE